MYRSMVYIICNANKFIVKLLIMLMVWTGEMECKGNEEPSAANIESEDQEVFDADSEEDTSLPTTRIADLEEV